MFRIRYGNFYYHLFHTYPCYVLNLPLTFSVEKIVTQYVDIPLDKELIFVGSRNVGDIGRRNQTPVMNLWESFLILKKILWKYAIFI